MGRRAFLGTFKEPGSWCDKEERPLLSLDINVFSSKLMGLSGFDFDRHLFTCFKANLPSRPLLSGFVCSLIPQVTPGPGTCCSCSTTELITYSSSHLAELALLLEGTG